MTGTLVHMGQKIANALRGEGDARWVPHLALWTMLVVGAIAGARAVIWSPPLAYGLAVLFAAGLAARAPWAGRSACRRAAAGSVEQLAEEARLVILLVRLAVKTVVMAAPAILALRQTGRGIRTRVVWGTQCSLRLGLRVHRL